MEYKTNDLRISEIKTIIPPAVLHEELQITQPAAKTTFETREAIHNILAGNDDRLVVIAGPCSIHDIKSANEYAGRLKLFAEQYRADLLVIMRVYFEKPRTTVGWKGLINDPLLDSSFQINKGLRLARELLLHLNETGVPAATEYLDPIIPQYFADLISWGAIGARTTESQVHRELASGLSCPVGFKNGTDGTTKIAVDAVGAAAHPHHFVALLKEGTSGIFATTGNPDCHVILRGGKQPNYDSASLDRVAAELEAQKLPVKIMIDFSHANSRKQHGEQITVCQDVCKQLASREQRIFGVMIESHLLEGRQDLTEGRALNYGQSITDACLGWEDTTVLFEDLARAVRQRRSA